MNVGPDVFLSREQELVWLQGESFRRATPTASDVDQHLILLLQGRGGEGHLRGFTVSHVSLSEGQTSLLH